MLTVQQLRVLAAIKESASMTKAAELLACSIATVVHHLNAMEHEHGVQLVVRAKSGAVLTPIGQMLAVDSERILSHIAQAERAIADARDAGLSLLRIGTFASAASKILAPAIVQLQKQSGVRVEVIESEPSDSVRLLRTGAIHAALIYDSVDSPMAIHRQLNVHPLAEEPYRLLMSKAAARDMPGLVDFTDLQNTGWVFSHSDNEASDRIIRNACREAGFEPRVLVRTDDLSMIHGLVAHGIGVALAAESTVDHQSQVILRATRQDLGRRRISFAWQREPRISAVDVLLRLLRNRMSSPRT
jgi:DNA-binding transcriptional LysR family regulator